MYKDCKVIFKYCIIKNISMIIADYSKDKIFSHCVTS